MSQNISVEEITFHLEHDFQSAGWKQWVLPFTQPWPPPLLVHSGFRKHCPLHYIFNFFSINWCGKALHCRYSTFNPFSLIRNPPFYSCLFRGFLCCLFLYFMPRKKKTWIILSKCSTLWYVTCVATKQKDQWLSSIPARRQDAFPMIGQHFGKQHNQGQHRSHLFCLTWCHPVNGLRQ